MNTKKFRTRQDFQPKINPKGKHYIIGLDAGYSSMKVYHELGYFCFPSFVKSVSENLLTVPSADDILYRDKESDEIFMVGKTAQEMVFSSNTNDTDEELFSRNRYTKKQFQILCNVALALALKNKKDNREIVVQTGLPIAYMEADSEPLKRSLSRKKEFEIKVGHEEWTKCTLNLDKNNIYIMPQPAGSFYSSLIKSDGNYISDAKEILHKNVLVMDIGFGTFDFYGVKSRTLVCRESINDIGMRRVLKETSDKILKELNEDIRVPALQKNLETGTIIYVDDEELSDKEVALAPFLEQSNQIVFQKAMQKAKEITNSFRDYQYIIIGGGTGEAWFESIQKYLSGLKTIKVIASNRNDNLPFLYSNVRGYYLYRCIMDKR